MNGLIYWSPGVTLEGIEQQVILKAFEHYRQNKTATAGALGISIRTLDSKLERYEAESEKERERREESQRKGQRDLARARGQTVPETEASRNPPNAGVRVESTAHLAAKPKVSVYERSEIQEVLPSKAAGGGSRGRR